VYESQMAPACSDKRTQNRTKCVRGITQKERTSTIVCGP